MVNFKRCEVTRYNHSVVVEQFQDVVVISNPKTDQELTVPNGLLADLSSLLEYIAGYHE